MLRAILRMMTVALLLAAGAVCSAAQADNDTIEAVKARWQKAIEAVAAKPSPRVLLVPIREEIDLRTAVFVEREMERAKEDKFDLVLVDMDTPGGRGDAMMRICQAFLQEKKPADKRIPVVAWVNYDAFSAGAIICISCSRIYMAPSSKIGAATGYVIDPHTGLPAALPEEVEAKFLSAEVAEVRALAKAAGYSPGIVEAMVDRGVGLAEYEIDGRREALTDKEFDNRRRDLKLSELSPAQYNSRVRVVKVICAKGELLTLDYEEAGAIGLSSGTLGTRAAVFEGLGLTSPVVVTSEHNWSEEVFGFLSSPAVRGILLLIGLGGLYFEFKTPGMVLPGVLGAVCLGLFFFSDYFMGLANYTGALIFVLGIALILFEIFFLPGHGVSIVVGTVLVFGGILLGMQPWIIPNVDNPFDVHLFMVNLLVIGCVVVSLAVFAVALAKLLPSMPLLNRIILTSTGPAGELRSSGTVEEQDKLLEGTAGTAMSRLRPAGRASFGARVLDVVTRGEFIEEGSAIIVIKVEGNRVVVRKAE